MAIKHTKLALVTAAALIVGATPTGAGAQYASAVGSDDALHAGQLDVPVNKSQILRADRPFSRALIGNDEVADILPMNDRSLYVLGKKVGTTSLTLYDRSNNLISIIDIAVGPDIVGLRRQLSEIMPNEQIAVRMSNDAIVLSGTVSSGPAVDRAYQLASTYAPEKVVNLLSVGSVQQVMLEVRFSEMSRQVGKQIGFNHAFMSNNGRFQGGIGETAPSTALLTNQNGQPVIDISKIVETFGLGAGSFSIGSLNLFSALDLMERKGLVKTLAEPTLIALSGQPASFLAGGEFPVPVAQGGSGDSNNITVEFKPFGVSLGFTPTVLDDGVINLVAEPEVSSIDRNASININGLVIPGLQTRRASTTLELRDGQSFAIAGLIRSDFQDTVRQIPGLGSIPILGSLFRSTGFQRQETELVIIVTPRLVRPMRPEDVRLPTERVADPHELELFLMGKTERIEKVPPPSSAPVPATGVAPGAALPEVGSNAVTPPPLSAPAPGGKAAADPYGTPPPPPVDYDGPTGHELGGGK